MNTLFFVTTLSIPTPDINQNKYNQLWNSLLKKVRYVGWGLGGSPNILQAKALCERLLC